MMFSHSSTTDGGGVSFNFLVVVREKIRKEFAFVVTEVAHIMIFFISLFLSRGVAKGSLVWHWPHWSSHQSCGVMSIRGRDYTSCFSWENKQTESEWSLNLHSK